MYLQPIARRCAGWTGALLLAALLALGVGPAGAEQAGGQLDQQKKTYDAHRPYVTYHFKDAEMDFGLEWVLGSTSMGGCEIGEAFYAAGGSRTATRPVGRSSGRPWPGGWRPRGGSSWPPGTGSAPGRP